MTYSTLTTWDITHALLEPPIHNVIPINVVQFRKLHVALGIVYCTNIFESHLMGFCQPFHGGRTLLSDALESSGSGYIIVRIRGEQKPIAFPLHKVIDDLHFYKTPLFLAAATTSTWSG